MKEDSLGDRMKRNYEDRTRYYIPRRTYTIIRVDGKAFHSYCKDLGRPFDTRFMGAMDFTARHMCLNIQGSKMAYVQSDEISLVLTDFDSIQTDAWFDGNIQKIASISASMATAAFNAIRGGGYAMFDARVFSIPDIEEVLNYLVWRQQDATRNSIQMAGQSYFSHKQLQGVTCDQIQEKLFTEKSINWNDYPEGFKRGRVVTKYGNRDDTPVFTQDREWLKEIITPE